MTNDLAIIQPLPAALLQRRAIVYRTMTEAAKELGVTNHVIRRLIKDGILPANQIVDGAPYQIRADDLKTDEVLQALTRKERPCRDINKQQHSMFSNT